MSLRFNPTLEEIPSPSYHLSQDALYVLARGLQNRATELRAIRAEVAWTPRSRAAGPEGNLSRLPFRVMCIDMNLVKTAQALSRRRPRHESPGKMVPTCNYCSAVRPHMKWGNGEGDRIYPELQFLALGFDTYSDGSTAR
jgi:hypothetical protein